MVLKAVAELVVGNAVKVKGKALSIVCDGSCLRAAQPQKPACDFPDNSCLITLTPWAGSSGGSVVNDMQIQMLLSRKQIHNGRAEPAQGGHLLLPCCNW